MRRKQQNQRKFCLALWLGLLVFLFSPVKASAREEGLNADNLKEKSLSLGEFMDLAVKNDTEFERILIDELSLQYAKALTLPAGDIVLAVKSQYDFFLGQNREEGGQTVSLSKLFPLVGTNLKAEYKAVPSYSTASHASDFTLEVSQPIASNAFGKTVRLKDKIIGLEMDVARHQIVEAYEDYLASLISGYYDWHAAYAHLQVGESSYAQNLKLLDNIKERQQSNIALPIDVNKVHLQVLAKEEKLIELREEYQQALNFVEKAIRYEGKENLMPQEPSLYRDLKLSFNENFNTFREKSRTYQMLTLLEEKSQLKVSEEAQGLLPSIDLFAGYHVKGEGYGIQEEDNKAYVGLSLEWPLGQQIERAEYETAKIASRKRELANAGIHFQLYSDLRDLFFQIQSKEALISIAQEKIDLAGAILEAETENYSFGKVTLNDYIAAVNVLDNNRFNEISHANQYKKFIIEWLRITDQLVSEKEILPEKPL